MNVGVGVDVGVDVGVAVLVGVPVGVAVGVGMGVSVAVGVLVGTLVGAVSMVVCSVVLTGAVLSERTQTVLVMAVPSGMVDKVPSTSSRDRVSPGSRVSISQVTAPCA